MDHDIPRRHFLGSSLAAALSLSMAGKGSGASPAAAPAENALRKHRITAIDFKRVSQPYPRHVGKNAVRDVHGRGSQPEVAILTTDQGAVGWGCLRGSPEKLAAEKSGMMGRTVAELFDPATGYRVPEALPYDVPLHDLAGVILGLPVWKMIGGGDKPILTKIYSGMIYFDELEPANQAKGVAVLVDQCRWDRDHGYRQFKVKIGRGHKWMPPEEGLRRDIEVVRAIHQAFPDCEILVDSNNGYNVETAIRFLEGIKGVPLFWFEEPFHEKPEDWRKLHRWMQANGFGNTYRADGEYAPDTRTLDLLGSEGVVNMRLEDIISHGFTEWRKLLPILAKQHVAASPHAWGAGIKSVYIGHLAAALGNIPTIEGVTCGEDEVLLGDNRIVDGRFQPSSAPGFGMKLRKQ